MNNTIQVVAAPHPIKAAQTITHIQEGPTARQILETVRPPYFSTYKANISVNGQDIPEVWWDGCRPKAGTLVNVNVVPQGGGGGKNPLRTVLSLAIAIAAPYAAPAIGGAIGLSTSASIFGISVNLASAVGGAIFSVAGGLIVNAIAPPGNQSSFSGPQRADPKRDSPTYFVEGARNEKRPDAPVPVVLGRIRHVPPLGADNYTESRGDDQYVRQAFVWGHGPLQVSGLKIGETPLEEYDDYEIETDDGSSGEIPNLTLYPNDVLQAEQSVLLSSEDDWTVRRSGVSADELVLEFTFPQGLGSFDDQGKKRARSVTLEIEYSVADADDWQEWETVTFQRAYTSAVRYAKRLSVPTGQYDIRVRRTTADSSSSQIFDEVYWTAVKSINAGPPILMKNCAASAMVIRGNEQLNGPVDRLSGLCETVCLDWDKDSGQWVERTSNNPASLYRYILQSGAIDVPLPDDRIDLDMLEEWHEFCEENGFTFNFIIDYETTIDAVLHDIAAAGRAAAHSLDGIRTVVIDRPQTVYSQYFTPDNTKDFKGEIIFYEPVHGWRVEFRNELEDFKWDERIVYADGYSEANATIIRDLDLPGVTNPDQVYRLGREHIAELIHRPEIFTFVMDFEHLSAVKGSLCSLTHDVPLFGLHSGRIKSVTAVAPPLTTEDGTALTTEGGEALTTEEAIGVTHITLDETVSMESGVPYSIRIRLQDGSSIVRPVKTQAGETTTLEFVSPLVLENGPQAGDLFQFGETGKESVDVVVQTIRRRSDYMAEIRCVPAAPEIFTASQGVIPPHDAQISVPPELRRPVAPIIKGIQTGEEVMVRNIDGSISTRMVIAMENLNTGQVEPVVRVRNAVENAYGPGQIISSTPTQIVLEGFDEGQRYDIEVYYRRIGGTRILTNEYSPPGIKNNVLFVGSSEPPQDVVNFKLSALGDTAWLSWDPVSNIDHSHYEIRYSPETSGVVWGAAQVLRTKVTALEISLPLSPGSYLVKAVDRGGEYSSNAALVVTNVPGSNFNVLETLAEDPGFTGAKSNVREESDQLILDDPALLTGMYTFANSLDLGAVYTSRLKPRVVARGSTLGNTLDSWGPLNTVASLSGGATPEDWRVVLQFRTTEDDPSGTPTWSEWQEVVVGQYRFRAIEFRVILNTFAPNITPAISRLEVEVDMEDRILPRKGLDIPVDGARIDFVPAFKSLRSVLVTEQNLSSGDRLVKSNEDETGVDLEFFDSAGNSIARTIDLTAIGYGRQI